MPTDTRTPDQIERDIERERAELADAVDALQRKFSPEAVIREIAGGVRRHGGEFGTAVSRSAKQNPLALAVTGVGLAWLIFGRSHDDPAEGLRRGADRRSFDRHPDTGIPWTGYPDWAQPDPDDGAGQMARNAAERTRKTRERLAQGTETLGETARERVIDARSRALDMAGQAEEAALRGYRRSRDATADFIEERPLVAGAIAMAAGAALAGALPRTRREDETFGETRDALFDEAERIFREESHKAGQAVQAAAEEVGDIVGEARAGAGTPDISRG
ncbi:Protein of unknown function [Lutimaribacter pacificus]|uniref:DUF3618 domain-containing protein n=1 Tax=Lutimaribacter pacificus TaxID=391948 RepID=A0A1H0M6A6_9RHOB|nr:DUF3618 domain-containing protein [Lutimaribacter pacificus]SDO76042.1 Protein of unknown function [Lutimaribacter pacificus]SHK78352.1 Protein of unknown function [Lutimaribacter pacificus]